MPDPPSTPYPTPHHGPSATRLAEYNAELDRLHTLCTHLVDTLAPRLPDADRRRVQLGLAVGEWLFLLDDLCAALLGDHIPVTAAERDLLAAAIDLCGLGDEKSPHLRDPEATLAALVIEPAAGSHPAPNTDG